MFSQDSTDTPICSTTRTLEFATLSWWRKRTHSTEIEPRPTFNLVPAGHHIHDILLADRACAHFGDQHFAGGLTINSKVAPLTDYTGFYAHNALAPVATYVDRSDLRQQLEAHLHACIAVAHHQTQTVVVYGIGGAGKTQLVLDYIQRHRQDHAAIYNLLYNIPLDGERDAVQLQDAVPTVKRWFYRRGKRWLFVFDNADTISNPNNPSYIDLRYFLPNDPCINIVFTSRDRSATEISELSAVEIEEPTSQQQEQIESIVHGLGYLALATTLAGSYVAATPRLRGDLTQYLPEYRERRKTLLTQRLTWLVHQYGESVLTTWETTYRAIEGHSPEACQFLTLLSFFNHDDIPASFPTDLVDSEAPTWVAILFREKRINAYNIEGFFRVLTSFSLIKYKED